MLLVNKDLFLRRSWRSLALASASLSLALKQSEIYRGSSLVVKLQKVTRLQSYPPGLWLLFDFWKWKGLRASKRRALLDLRFFGACFQEVTLPARSSKSYQHLGLLSIRVSKQPVNATCLHSFFWKVHHLCNNSELLSLSQGKIQPQTRCWTEVKKEFLFSSFFFTESNSVLWKACTYSSNKEPEIYLFWIHTQN